MTSEDEFESYLSSLTNEQYDFLMEERIARLSPELQTIPLVREAKRKERFQLLTDFGDGKISSNDLKEKLASLGEDYASQCEHGRSYCKHCVSCAEIDFLMFPEIFNKDGFRHNEEV